MKKFLIESPCYRANGNNGKYCSIAFTDEKGNILKGIGDHISSNSYGIKNVYDAEGSSFSDSDRFIGIKEIFINENEFEQWLENYTKVEDHNKNIDQERERLFTSDPYNYVFSDKKLQKEREPLWNRFHEENKYIRFPYYSFLELIKNEN